MRKTNLFRLLARRVDGISLGDIEQGEIVPDLFRHACLMGLEGLVSKHRDSAYRGDRFRHRIKNQESGTSRLPPRAGSILDGTIPSAQRRFSGRALQSPRRQRGPGSARFRSKKCRASCFVGAL
jgi:hypothetical protein